MNAANNRSLQDQLDNENLAVLAERANSGRIQAELQQERVRSATLADENKKLKRRLEELESARPVEATNTVPATLPVQQLDAGCLTIDCRLGPVDTLLGGGEIPEDVMCGARPKRRRMTQKTPSPSLGSIPRVRGSQSTGS